MANQHNNADNNFLSLIPVHGNMAVVDGAFTEPQSQSRLQSSTAMANQNVNYLTLAPVHGNMAVTKGAFISQRQQRRQERRQQREQFMQQRISSGSVQGNVAETESAFTEPHSQFDAHGISSSGRAQGDMPVIDGEYISQQQSRAYRAEVERQREEITEMRALTSHLSGIDLSSSSSPTSSSTPAAASHLNKGKDTTLTQEESKDLVALTAVFSEGMLEGICSEYECSKVSAVLKCARLFAQNESRAGICGESGLRGRGGFRFDE
jgi:hypothetical protein